MNITSELKSFAGNLGADLIGVADLGPFRKRITPFSRKPDRILFLRPTIEVRLKDAGGDLTETDMEWI